MCSSLNPTQCQQWMTAFSDAQKQGSHPPIVTYDQLHDKGILDYSSGMRMPKISAHFGQRKLFLSELHFLTQYLRTRTSNLPLLVVYPGAAPSKHTGYLAQLFPEVTFILIDPTRFGIKRAGSNIAIVDLTPTKDMGANGDAVAVDWNPIIDKIKLKSIIYTINAMFTDDMSVAIKERFTGLADLLLISDIRTNTARGIPDDLDTCWNLAQQYLWVKILEPSGYLLKFRYPYFVNTSVSENSSATSFSDRFMSCAKDEPFHSTFERAKQEGLDMVSNYIKQVVHYLPGTLDIQAFAGQTSTELRLSNLNYQADQELVVYPDWKSYEGEMCMFNRVWRSVVLHDNPYADSSLGLDHCNDCSLEVHFWEEYLKYRKIVVDTKRIHQHVSTLSYYSCGSLRVHNHGLWFGDYQPMLDSAKQYYNSLS